MSKKRVFLWQNNGVALGAIETDFGGGAVLGRGRFDCIGATKNVANKAMNTWATGLKVFEFG